MSRNGKIPVTYTDALKVSLNGSTLTVASSKNELTLELRSELVNVEVSEGEINVTPKSEEKEARVMWGTTRALINNMILGLTTGYSKKLEIIGVGYNAKIQGSKIVLALGFSHPVEMDIPAGVDVVVEGQFVTVSGFDKQKVGQFTALIRAWRKPEPYKGKGIRYIDEFVARKVGKRVAA